MKVLLIANCCFNATHRFNVCMDFTFVLTHKCSCWDIDRASNTPFLLLSCVEDLQGVAYSLRYNTVCAALWTRAFFITLHPTMQPQVPSAAMDGKRQALNKEFATQISKLIIHNKHCKTTELREYDTWIQQLRTV